MQRSGRTPRFSASLPFLLLLASCQSGHAPQPAAADAVPADGDAYVSASLGDASRLNPLLSTDSASNEICSLVFNGLVKYDKDIRLVGDLAESWEVREGGKEIVFRLRRNVRWHDGEPFTSGDVKFTFEKLLDPAVATPFRADYELVESLETPDPWTVRVRYKEPFAPALESWGMGVIPRHVFEKGDFNANPANRRPVGTGPYKFLDWKTDEKIVLTANPDYFEGRPHFNRYIFRVVPDQSVQFLEMRNGSVDAVDLTPDQYNAYDESFRLHHKFRYPSFSYSFFAFNLRSPLFQDLRVRQALAHAVDKREIIDGVLLGFGRPATGPYPPTSWAFNEEAPDHLYDLEKARVLLAEAGWRDSDGDGILDKDGRRFAFTVITNQGNKTRELCAVVLQSQFAKLGIRMDIRILEWASFLHDYVDKREFDALILGWNLSRDPDAYIIWHSSQQGEGRYNFVGYANPDTDKLVEAGRREFDFAKRRALYREFHALVARDLPYIFLYYPEAMPVVHKRIVGPKVAPAGLGWNFREWFVPKQLQKYQYAS